MYIPQTVKLLLMMLLKCQAIIAPYLVKIFNNLLVYNTSAIAHVNKNGHKSKY